MQKKISIHSLYRRLAMSLVIAAILGWALNAIWLTLFLTCFTFIIWHYSRLSLFINWLWQSKHITPPQTSGIWGQIFDSLYVRTKKARNKQKIQNHKIKLFRDGAEALPDAAIVISEDLTISWANKKARDIIGVKKHDDVGQRIDNLIRNPLFTQYIEKADFSQPCNLPSAISPDIQLEIRFMPYGSEQILLLIRDISQIHRLNSMRRDFVANVSHELKTPLTVVRGYVEMMQMSENDLPPRWQQTFASIEGQVTRMNRLVEQLLELSKVEVSQKNREQPVNMSNLLQVLVKELSWLNKDKKHDIQLNITDNLIIQGSETELKSACMNLITNAIAYTPAQGIIKITWQKKHKHAIFSVEDNGPGIKQEHINRLTERFYRIDPSRSRDTGGSGLGLSIVKHVLQHHHAKLTINSQWGNGSTFSIYFNLPN
jgi:two-component system phosphate regulon sensor histidine kinase PhoR